VLWDALKRAHLTDPKLKEVLLPTSDEAHIVSQMKANRFSLDAPVDDEGGNVSMGEVRILEYQLGMSLTLYHTAFFDFFGESSGQKVAHLGLR